MSNTNHNFLYAKSKIIVKSFELALIIY